MIAQFVDTVAGAPVYINPAFVVSVRPDPADPDHASLVKLNDGENVRVRGSHVDVADRLTRAAA
jgi:hypothetical protein